jgi:transketolase
MGDLQTDLGESLELQFVPVSEFARVRAAGVRAGGAGVSAGASAGASTVASAAAVTRAFAALARINTLSMIAGAWSGHIGTSFSSIEIMSWIFLNELRNLEKGPEACDIFFSSKGHDAPGLYTVLIGLGLLPPDKLYQLRRLDGLPGHPHVETPYIQANTGSLGMGISKAKGMAIANRLAGTPRRIFVLTGDGELQEGQLWESLASAVRRGLGEIVVIVDHNKIQSDTWVRGVSDLGDVEAKFRAFGWHVSRCDGHDVAALDRTFRSLDAIVDRPKVIVADTIKGKGVSFMEGPAMKAGELYGYHSGAPNEQSYAAGLDELLGAANERLAEIGLSGPVLERRTRPPRREVRQTDNLVAAYERALVAQAASHPRLLALDADLVKDCGLMSFAATYPDRFVECGIAEQDMVSMAAGMARRGALPVVHSFACFLAARPNEQIYNQCSEGSKVLYVGSLAGLLPGGPGHSHQSVRDISALAAVPNLVMAEPSSEAELAVLFDALVNHVPESAYLRLVSVKWPMPFAYPEGLRVEVGKGWTVRDGRTTSSPTGSGCDVVVFGYGPWMLANAYEAIAEIETSAPIGVTSEAGAAEAATARGHTSPSITLVCLPWLNRVDSDWLRETVGACRSVVTLDNHYVHGGQGHMVAAAIAALGPEPGVRVTQVGVTELPECGTNDEVMGHHGLDVPGLVRHLRHALLPVA